MRLVLSPLPDTLRGPQDESYRGRLPKRARFLEPSAAGSLLRLVARAPWITLTDVYRSPESSLAAARSKRGVKAPGFSGHNFGWSIDLDVGACLKAGGLRYPELLELVGDEGWFCHRRDGDPNAIEHWHINYLGQNGGAYLKLATLADRTTWDDPVEARIVERYGASFLYDTAELQSKLAKLWLYRGELDGEPGPLTREAVGAFQRAWGLPDDGLAGVRTKRVLAVVSAEVELVTPMA